MHYSIIGGIVVKKYRESLLYSTFILTVANFIVRLMGFVYKIIISRIAGAETMGLIQLILPLYFTFISIVASGIPIALSRTIAKHRSLENNQAIKDTITSTLIGISLLSGILFFIFILNINFFSNNLLKYDKTKIPLILLSPCIVIIAIKSIFKGFFYGIKKVHIPALSDIFEQMTRIGLVFLLFYYVEPDNIEVSACIIVVGMVMGELISLLFLHVRYYNISKSSSTKSTPTSRYMPILSDMCKIAFPITITRVVLSVVSSISSILVPRRLVRGGMSPAQALNTFGIMGGMVMPLLFIPFTIINGLSTILIPNLSEDITAKRWNNIRDKVSKSIIITSATAFFCTGILVVLGEHIGFLLFKEQDVGKYLVPSSLFLILLCLQQTLSSVMNGLGLEKSSARNNIIGGIVELITIYFLIPKSGIYGYIGGFYLGSTVVIVLHYISIHKKIYLKPNITQWFLKPAFSSLFMTSCIRLIFLKLIDLEVSSYIALLLPSFTGIIIFAIVFLLLNPFPQIFQKKSI